MKKGRIVLAFVCPILRRMSEKTPPKTCIGKSRNYNLIQRKVQGTRILTSLR